MWNSRKLIRRGVFIVITAVIFGYAASKSVNLLEGPQLIINSPENGATVQEPLLPIKGSAKNIAFLSLNDRQIYVDDTGNLAEQVLLYEGYNIITLTAHDKFGRETKVTREIIYLPTS